MWRTKNTFTLSFNLDTVWKFKDFSIIHNLREINSGKISSKLLFLSIFVNLVHFSLQKLQKFMKTTFRASKCVKMAKSALLESPKLISRKM